MINEPKHYEFTFIISGNIAEDQHQEGLNKIKTLLEKNQTQNITVISEIGRRKFAYPIKKLRHGFYFVWEFDLLPQELLKIERELKINKEVLRYLIIKKKIKTPEEIAREEKVKISRVKEQLAKEKEAIIAEEKKEKPPRAKVSLDDLDKKLDELLSEEIK
jgi:small subunit ribosomal protein S6